MNFPLKPPRSSAYVAKLCRSIIPSHFPPNFHPPHKGFTPESDEYDFNYFFHQRDNVLLIIGKMLTFGLYRSPTTSHSVIQALSKALELSLAITYLTRMGLKNDAQTYAMVISYLQEILEDGYDSLLHPDKERVRPYPYSRGESILQGLQASSLKITLFLVVGFNFYKKISWHTRRRSVAGKVSLAVRYLTRMGFKNDVETYMVVIKSLRKLRIQKKGMALYTTVIKRGLDPASI
ncbi:hypothetical protein Gogos_001466 [Gossypium gossypioides]|uniref:Uncharacterized protein n=1 Tax=Gossypium gossypioides TaxID=34282 RepID=A0A7J9CVV8_GOSGO|nr:hypothetical protein [Gossypium gossypioides]